MWKRSKIRGWKCFNFTSPFIPNALLFSCSSARKVSFFSGNHKLSIVHITQFERGGERVVSQSDNNLPQFTSPVSLSLIRENRHRSEYILPMFGLRFENRRARGHAIWTWNHFLILAFDIYCPQPMRAEMEPTLDFSFFCAVWERWFIIYQFSERSKCDEKTNRKEQMLFGGLRENTLKKTCILNTNYFEK